jgi:hypothetical protein
MATKDGCRKVGVWERSTAPFVVVAVKIVAAVDVVVARDKATLTKIVQR